MRHTLGALVVAAALVVPAQCERAGRQRHRSRYALCGWGDNGELFPAEGAPRLFSGAR